jgi:hypothetical protein
MSLKVFVLGGAVMIVAGAAQLFIRPPNPREKGPQRFVNGATVRAVVFVTVGVLAVLLGLGVVPFVPLKL